MDEMKTAIARLEEQVKSLDHRMGNLEHLTQSVQDIALSVKELALRQASTEEDVETLTGEVNEIREKPAKRWDAIIAALIAAIVGAGIGHFIK